MKKRRQDNFIERISVPFFAGKIFLRFFLGVNQKSLQKNIRQSFIVESAVIGVKWWRGEFFFFLKTFFFLSEDDPHYLLKKKKMLCGKDACSDCSSYSTLAGVVIGRPSGY